MAQPKPPYIIHTCPYLGDAHVSQLPAGRQVQLLQVREGGQGDVGLLGRILLGEVNENWGVLHQILWRGQEEPHVPKIPAELWASILLSRQQNGEVLKEVRTSWGRLWMTGGEHWECSHDSWVIHTSNGATQRRPTDMNTFPNKGAFPFKSKAERDTDTRRYTN